MGYTDHDVKKMLNAVELAIAHLTNNTQPDTVSELKMTKDFLERLLEEGRV